MDTEYCMMICVWTPFLCDSLPVNQSATKQSHWVHVKGPESHVLAAEQGMA